MENYQFWTLVAMLGAGFGWLIHRMDGIVQRLDDIDKRLTVVETILAMMGMPIKEKK